MMPTATHNGRNGSATIHNKKRYARQPENLADEIGKSSPFNNPEQEAFLNLIRTYEALSEDFDYLFKSAGLTAAQYNALRILRGAGGRLQIYQIADHMVSRQPDITRLINRIEQAGFVRRFPCENDRRVVWIEITQRGLKTLKKLDHPVETLHKRQLAHLGPKKIAALNKLLFEARHDSKSKPSSRG